MKNVNFIFVFMWLCVLGCAKNEDKIEIYLLKRRAEILDGVDYAKAKGLKDTNEIKQYQFYKYDTLFKDEISAGRFEVKKEDLHFKPFINDNEIKSFNLNDNNINFSKEVLKRLSELPDTMHEGIQFAVTVNRCPVLSGYFMDGSVWCDWYYIRYDHGKIEESQKLQLYNGYMRGKHEDLTPPYPPELIEAFRSSGRLIE